MKRWDLDLTGSVAAVKSRIESHPDVPETFRALLIENLDSPVDGFYYNGVALRARGFSGTNSHVFELNFKRIKILED